MNVRQNLNQEFYGCVLNVLEIESEINNSKNQSTSQIHNNHTFYSTRLIEEEKQYDKYDIFNQFTKQRLPYQRK